MVIGTLDRNAESATLRRRKAAAAILDGIEAEGLPGLITAVGRMIGDDQPSIDCFRQAEVDFGGAQTGEQFWDAALDFAACLKEAELEPEPPDRPDPPDGPPDPPPPPPHDWRDNMSSLVLAALLMHVHKQSTVPAP